MGRDSGTLLLVGLGLFTLSRLRLRRRANVDANTQTDGDKPVSVDRPEWPSGWRPTSDTPEGRLLEICSKLSWFVESDGVGIEDPSFSESTIATLGLLRTHNANYVA